MSDYDRDERIATLERENADLRRTIAESPAAAELLRAAPGALRFRDAEHDRLRRELAKADRRTAEQERIITAYRHVHRQLADAIGEDPGTGSELAGCVENKLRVLRSGLTEALGIIARARDGFFDTTTEAVDARCEELRKITEVP